MTLRNVLKEIRQQKAGVKPQQPHHNGNGKPHQGNGKKKAEPAPVQKAEPAPAPPQKKADPKAPDLDSVVQHQCGHRQGVRYLVQSLCLGCAIKAQRKQKKAPGVTRTQAKLERGTRLPDGAVFHMSYNAEKVLWAGSLTVGDIVVEAEASGAVRLLQLLDNRYRTAAAFAAEAVRRAERAAAAARVGSKEGQIAGSPCVDAS